MWEEIYYIIEYHDTQTKKTQTILISAPHPIEKIKSILSEVHPEWEISKIVPKEVTQE